MLQLIAWLTHSLPFCLTTLLMIINSHSVVLHDYLDSLEIHLALLFVFTLAENLWLGIGFNLRWVKRSQQPGGCNNPIISKHSEKNMYWWPTLLKIACLNE